MNLSRATGVSTMPKVRLEGHDASIPFIVSANILSSPMDGNAYTAGERFEFLLEFSISTDFPELRVATIWLGNGAQFRREARLVGSFDAARILNQIYAYTVQPGDIDTDGIYIRTDPLGDNADIDIGLVLRREGG